MLLPYVFHVHAKDFNIRSGARPDPGEGWRRTRGGNRSRGCIVGHGDVPVLWCLGLVNRSGYGATITIEFEGDEDPMVGVAQSRSNIDRFWKEIEL